MRAGRTCGAVAAQETGLCQVIQLIRFHDLIRSVRMRNVQNTDISEMLVMLGDAVLTFGTPACVLAFQI
jgi:hypothetical protein